MPELREEAERGSVHVCVIEEKRERERESDRVCICAFVFLVTRVTVNICFRAMVVLVVGRDTDGGHTIQMMMTGFRLHCRR